jgi:hypothetical protein
MLPDHELSEITWPHPASTGLIAEPPEEGDEAAIDEEPPTETSLEEETELLGALGLRDGRRRDDDDDFDDDLDDDDDDDFDDDLDDDLDDDFDDDDDLDDFDDDEDDDF